MSVSGWQIASDKDLGHSNSNVPHALTLYMYLFYNVHVHEAARNTNFMHSEFKALCKKKLYDHEHSLKFGPNAK